ncbi:S9 family peptidase [Streptomyces sulphureus]|uniref:S9 family peptidase n=1 Tax=Streptomyces sulphureus TaxID=47758 RepID=UPI000362C84C|nr:prolyl oligopeptidase family serine peptidase [Streptomyces sulphureus]
MATPQVPYGSWPSPVDAALVAAHDGVPEYLDSVGDEVWWTEPRPREGGRRALLRLRSRGGEPETVLPEPWNARNRVLEYGGKPWAGVPEATGPLVVFTHDADQRLYRLRPETDAAPLPLTPLEPRPGAGEPAGREDRLAPQQVRFRWADPSPLPLLGEVWCVREEYTGPAPTDVRRDLVAVPLDGSAAEDADRVRLLTRHTHHFVTGPRTDAPDGGAGAPTRVAWLAWDHPSMPWDGTLLQVADVDPFGRLGPVRTVAGGPEEAVAQAEWTADGALLYATDADGWWNLRRLDPTDGEPGPPVRLCPREEEFAGALWRIGHRWFAPLESGLIAAVHGRGSQKLGVLDPDTGELVDAAGPWTEWTASLGVVGSRVVGIAASPRSSPEVVELDTRTGRTRPLAAPRADPVDPAYYPEPLLRTFSGPGGREVHAHIYPPHHPECTAPEGELPPYVIWAHGGPTGRLPLVLDLEIAYFTSRGIGVAEVNYGGSTGYGREYRNRLRGQWGVVDVEDCATVARALAEEGIADGARLAIRGGSAGGWTSASSLTSPATSGLYACAAISYPVLDLEQWSQGETHDFESQYLHSLIGPPEQVPGRYRERSPLRRAQEVTAPFLLLQGTEDAICPPAQCERFLREAAEGPSRSAYLTFEGEGHGFRRAETIVKAVEAELSLYAQTFAFSRPDVPALELT